VRDLPARNAGFARTAVVTAGLPDPGTGASWQATAARAAATTAAVLSFGVLDQWPTRTDHPALLLSNLVVSAGFACRSVLISGHPPHSATRWALLAASIAWSIA
jgi:hypothetical protein